MMVFSTLILQQTHQRGSVDYQCFLAGSAHLSLLCLICAAFWLGNFVELTQIIELKHLTNCSVEFLLHSV